MVKTVDYTYDLANQLIGEEVIAGSSDTVSRYVYDGGLTPQAAGGIVGATNATAVNLAAQLATFATGASAAGNIVLSFDGSGNLQNRNLWGPQADQLFADETAVGNVLWPLADNENTIRDVVNATGAVQDHLVYDAFGNITSQTNASQQSQYTYTGQMLDPATGLMYYKSRWYDPQDGRFITQDPKSFQAGDVNLQRYVNNDPLRFVDPTGMDNYQPGGQQTRWGNINRNPIHVYISSFPYSGPIVSAPPPFGIKSFPAGTKVFTQPDGSIIIAEPGGFQTQVAPNGQVTPIFGPPPPSPGRPKNTLPSPTGEPDGGDSPERPSPFSPGYPPGIPNLYEGLGNDSPGAPIWKIGIEGGASPFEGWLWGTGGVYIGPPQSPGDHWISPTRR